MYWRSTSYWRWIVPVLITLGLLTLLPSTQRSMALSPYVVPETAGSIAGKVTNPDGAPLAGIEVNLERMWGLGWQPYRLTASDSNGFYRLGALSVGTYRLKFSDPSGKYGTLYYRDVVAPKDALPILMAGSPITAADVALPIAGALSGTVRSEIEGILHSVTLSARTTDGSFDTVGYLGYENFLDHDVPYLFRGLAPGVYRVCVFIDPFPSGLYSCYGSVFEPHTPTDIAMTAGAFLSHINIIGDNYTQRASIAGTVRSDDGQLLPTINVHLLRQENQGWVEQAKVVTDQIGRYYFGNRSAGIYTLGFADPATHYIPEHYGDAPTQEQALPITITEGEHSTNPEVTLTPFAQITGTVLIQNDAPPLFADLSLYQMVGSEWKLLTYARSDSKSGQYSFPRLRAGNYRLKMESSLGYGKVVAYYGGATLEEATTITLQDGQLLAGINFNLGQNEFTSAIGGTVTDGMMPLAGIKIELLTGDYEFNRVAEQLSDPAGHYRFDNLLSGKYVVYFSDPTGNFASQFFDRERIGSIATRVTVAEIQSVTNVDGQLVRGGAVSGIVRNHTGAPLSGIQVKAYRRTGNAWAYHGDLAVTDVTGNYALRPLARYLLFRTYANWAPRGYPRHPCRQPARCRRSQRTA